MVRVRSDKEPSLAGPYDYLEAFSTDRLLWMLEHQDGRQGVDAAPVSKIQEILEQRGVQSFNRLH